jgi:SAM-dependent methyltransferase
LIYADYAPIYDLIGQGAFAEALVSRVLAALPAPPRSALDLACGTGAALLRVAEAGAEAVGVDRSPHMLAIAGARARDRGLSVALVEADIRRLPIIDQRRRTQDERPAVSPAVLRSSSVLRPASFDLITCLYDSMNYLTGDDDLGLALAGAARLLRPGGWLVFDLNTEHEFARWDESDQVVHDDDSVLVYNRLSYTPATRLAHGRIVWFVRDGELWWRGEEQHTERAWGDAEVQGALGEAGLRLLARHTPLWQPAPPDAPRVVYVATHAT